MYCKKDHRKDKFKTVQFDFLGFSFQPRPTSSRDGEMFLGYDCAISRKSENGITEIFRKSEFHRWTSSDITRIAEEFNPKIRGFLSIGSMVSLALNLLCIKSRMMREYHVRFREGLGGKFPRSTRRSKILRFLKIFYGYVFHKIVPQNFYKCMNKFLLLYVII